MYKAKHNVALEIHQEIMEKKGPLSDDRLTNIEAVKLGFDLTKLAW